MNDQPITNSTLNDSYTKLYLLVSSCKGEPTVDDLKEIVSVAKDEFGQSLDKYSERENILTVAYTEPIYNFIKQCASMREIDGIEYYNVFGSWQKIILRNENNY